MSEAPRNQLPSGYNEDFVKAVEDDFQCVICHLPMKEPVQTRCGHRFCKECLEEHSRRQGDQRQPLTCPADRKSLDRVKDVFPDKATERKILSLAIKCPSEGCDWTGELRSKEIHLESCLFKFVSCTNENCHATARRKDLEQHVTITCQWRIIKCEHCSESHPHCQMQDHIAQCSKFPVTCPNNCGGSIPRELIPNHTENDCPVTIISCPNEQMGCKTKVQRKQVESHLQSAVRIHLDLACVKLNNTEVKLYDTEIKLNNTGVKLNKTEAKLNKTEVKLNKTEVKLNKTEAKLNNTEVKLINTEAKLEETARELMEKLDTLERRFEEKVIKDQENAIQLKLYDTKVKLFLFLFLFILFFLFFTQVKLNNTEAKLNKTEVKLYDTEAKLNKTEAKLNKTDAKLNNTEAKLNNTEAKLNNTDAKLEETTRELMEKLDTLERRFQEKVIKDQELEQTIRKLMQKLDSLERRFAEEKLKDVKAWLGPEMYKVFFDKLN